LAYFYKKNNINRTSGFTLVELMVTVTIMLIMTGTVIFNYGQFNESSVMNQVAYDLSLTIRQAQVYGVAAKQGTGSLSDSIDINTIDSANFKSAYGVHFDTTDNKQFILFIDVDDSGTYNDSAEQLQTYSFQRGIKIEEICVTGHGGSCGSGNGKTAGVLDITFLRPDPEANFKTSNPVMNGGDSATIYLQNADDNIHKSVVVYPTGQISVQ
jgi:prepilin-type N-terminal cleavage/methylation domain-containing protein